MITFATEFPLATGTSPESVLRLACDWVSGSPHTSIPESAFETLPTNESIQIKADAETVVLAAASTSDTSISGLQYQRLDDDLQWTTSIVAQSDVHETLFSLQISCESLGTATKLPPPKKPFIIKQVLKVLGGGSDGEIPVTDKPFTLGNGHADAAAALITGEAKNRLPIVYVSVGFDDELSVDPNRLATFVSGLAHVIVEPSREFSSRLRGLVGGKNVYGGTIGVYWPQSSARKSYYMERFGHDGLALQRAISDDLRQALANRRLTTTCTWPHLQEQLSRIRVSALREKGSSSVEAYVDAFDAELKAKEQRLAEADGEIQRLNSEIRRLAASSTSNTGSLLNVGKEHDLYPQELRDLLISMLSDSVRNVKDGSRRQHVLLDLLEINHPGNWAKETEASIKTALKDYRSMDAKTRSVLVDAGFSISEDGKHYKITFCDDPRYMFALPKTSSDHRAGKNAASEIVGTLF